MEDVTASSGTGTRPMRADARRNYERLVEAARTVFGERGSEASIEEIARTADVGIGTLYRHFPRRIDLVEAVYREDVDALVAKAADLCVAAQPWEALASWLDAFVAYAAAKRTFLTELHEAFEKSPDLAVSSREQIAAAARAVLTRAQDAGVARKDIDERELMQLVGGMCMARNTSLAENQRLLTFVLDGVRVQ